HVHRMYAPPERRDRPALAGEHSALFAAVRHRCLGDHRGRPGPPRVEDDAGSGTGGLSRSGRHSPGLAVRAPRATPSIRKATKAYKNARMTSRLSRIPPKWSRSSTSDGGSSLGESFLATGEPRCCSWAISWLNCCHCCTACLLPRFSIAFCRA